MSFICAITGKSSKPGEKPIRITFYRPKIYLGMREDEDTGDMVEVIVGRGKEPERELLATQEGFDLWTKTQAALGVDPDLITTTATKK